jgi:hypothetical protein
LKYPLGQLRGGIDLHQIVQNFDTNYILLRGRSRKSFARVIARVANELILVCVERIRAFLKASAILRKK